MAGSKNNSKSAGFPKRYAAALFGLSEKAGAVAQVEKDLLQIEEVASTSPEFSQLFQNPAISRRKMQHAVEVVMQALQTHELTKKFFGVLAQNRRLSSLAAIVYEYRLLVAAGKGEVTARIISAAPLQDQQLSTIKASLKASLGKEIRLETQVKPQLLGGVVIRVGSLMMDNSVAGKLAHLERLAKHALVTA